MQSRVLLQLLVRRACTPGVLSSRQIGMVVHAVRQLDALDVASSTTTSTNILSVVQTLCSEADGRSQANMLHALACATADQCSPRVTISALLSSSLQLLQEQLVEAATSLTASETILVMEALLRLAPFASGDGPLVYRQLLDEVQERSMSLASVVERPVELLGVMRVVVEAATSAPFTALSSSLAMPSLTSIGTASWANATLEHVLRVVQARLNTFTDHDLIELMDVLTVRRTAGVTEAPSAAPETSLPASSATTSLASSLPPLLHGTPLVRGAAARPAIAEASDRAVFLDAARFLLDDVLNRVLTSVAKLSVAQLAAWLTRLVRLHLTDHALLRAVVSALATAAMEKRDITAAQLSSIANALAALLPTFVAAPLEKWTDKELYVRTYAQALNLLVSRLHQRPRTDATVLVDAQATLLPLLASVPESALNAYLQQAAAVDGRMSMPSHAVTTNNTSSQVRIFVVLSATLEKATALLLRHYQELASPEQAHVAAFAFHWRLYMPRMRDGGGVDDGMLEGHDDVSDDVAEPPKAVEMVEHCSLVPTETLSRKHHALCGLVEGSMANFGARDATEVVNEIVVAHHQHHLRQLQRQQRQRRTTPAAATCTDSKGDAGDDSHTIAATSAAAKEKVAGESTSAMVETAARERSELVSRLFAQLQGPLQSQLADVHTAQLVRYLTSLSKMHTRARAPYTSVLQALKGRSLTSFEQISVLGVVARHHLRSRYIVYGTVRDLPQLAQTLQGTQKALLLKYLGQAGAQRLIKAPCAESLMPGVFFSHEDELAQLSLLELVFAFDGLVELRQNANATTMHVLEEMARRVQSGHPTITHGSSNGSGGSDSTSSDPIRPLNKQGGFSSVRSATTLAELVASFCRYGGPVRGVTAVLLVEAMRTLQYRVTSSRSLFVDLSQLTWYWPCVEQYFRPSSAVWGGCAPTETFTTEEWAELTATFHDLFTRAQRLVRARLVDIANSPQLRTNTFLWNQMACGVRFQALPPPGSPESERLWAHLERKELVPLLVDPQQLLDVMTLALHRLSEDVADADFMLRFVKKHVASMRVQDGLQVWWYASQYLSSAPKRTSSQQVKAHQLLQEVRDAAKQHVLDEDKSAEEKLSVMEQRLFKSLM